MLPVLTHILQHMGNIAIDADSYGYHHEGEQCQEPACCVDIVQPQGIEHLKPEGAELDLIILERLILLQYRADHSRDCYDHQQGNCQVHGAEKFQHQGAA